MANPPMDPAPSRAEESGQLPRWSPCKYIPCFVILPLLDSPIL